MTVTGLAIGARHEPVSSELTADAAAAATVLSVEWAELFTDAGGVLELNGAQLDYTTSDDQAKTITLTDPLADAAAAGDPVYVVDGGQVRTEYFLEVDLGDGDPVTVPIPYEQRDLWPEGPYADPVEVRVADDYSRLEEVPDRTPVRDGNFIDPMTLPDQVPTAAPAESPALTATGLSEWIILVTEEFHATTVLTYEVSVDNGATWDPLPNMPVRDQVCTVKRLADGSIPVPGVTYLFRNTASNAAGSAAPSASVPVQLDTSAAAVIAQSVIAATVTAGFILSGPIHVGGDSFILSQPGSDPDNPGGGLRLEQLNGGLVHLPADDTYPVLLGAGEAVIDDLEVTGQTRLGGSTTALGDITLVEGTVADPTVAPTVTNTWLSVKTHAVDPKSVCRNIGDDGWIILDGDTINEFDDTGTLVASATYPDLLGVTLIGAQYVAVTIRQKIAPATGYHTTALLLDAALAVTGELSPLIDASSPEILRQLVVSTDGTDLWLMDCFSVPGFLVGTAFDLVTGSVTGNPACGLDGTFDTLAAVVATSGDFGSPMIVAQPNAAPAQVWDGLTQHPEFEWPQPFAYEVRGLWWDGTNFWSLDQFGALRKLETITDAPAETFWWSYTWQDSDTHTTLASPETEHTRAARARVRIQGSPAPQVGLAGTHVANRVAFFAAGSSGGTKFRQGAVRPVGLYGTNVADVTLSGTTAPVANNWAGVPPAVKLVAETGGFSIDGESDGSVGTGTFAASGRTYALADGAAVTAAVSAASDAVAGKVELADDTEAAALSSTTVALPPGRLLAALAGLGHIERTADGTQSPGTGTTNTVLWATSAVAGRGGISYSAGVFTVTQPGRYTVAASVNFANDATATGRRLVQIRKNGTVVSGQNPPASATGEAAVNITGEFDCVNGDTIDIRASQNSGAALAYTVSSRISISNKG